MIRVDGSYGEGGGQILRTSLALSCLTGERARIENIRENRPNPGLRPQHVACARALSDLTGADVSGVQVGSTSLDFNPGKKSCESLTVDVGTAGSVTLVAQALLPAVFQSGKKTMISILGGTDVKWSPTVDYMKNVFLPVIRTAGFECKLELVRRGYYPAGGGEIRVHASPPADLKPFNLEKTPIIEGILGVSHAHKGLAKANVAERQAESAVKIFSRETSLNLEVTSEYCESQSYGSGLTLWAVYEDTVLGASSLGKKGLPAEKVGETAATDLMREIASNALLDEYMADQVIPYLAIVGGTVKASKITEHARTNAWIASLFGYDIKVNDQEKTIKASLS